MAEAKYVVAERSTEGDVIVLATNMWVMTKQYHIIDEDLVRSNLTDQDTFIILDCRLTRDEHGWLYKEAAQWLREFVSLLHSSQSLSSCASPHSSQTTLNEQPRKEETEPTTFFNAGKVDNFLSGLRTKNQERKQS
jgi:hypothetical protein